MNRIETMMRQGAAAGVFSGGGILVSVWGEERFRTFAGVTDIYTRTPVNSDIFFDLASLTKPLAISLCYMKLVDYGLSLDDMIGNILPASGKDKKYIKIIDLLCHKSGLPAHRPYYEILSGFPVFERRQRLENFLRAESPENPLGRKTVYSDIGFMMLRWILEEISGMRFDEYFKKMIVEPLGLKDIFFAGASDVCIPKERFAATENCPFRKKLIQGEVHDLNAFYSGGFDGHAGLFATLDAVGSLLKEVILACEGVSSNNVFDTGVVRDFFEIPYGFERAAGFDVRSSENSSCGNYFSAKTVGHLGYTGTSFWFDMETGLSVILLTNRIHPSAGNISIRDFRPAIHNCAALSV